MGDIEPRGRILPSRTRAKFRHAVQATDASMWEEVLVFFTWPDDEIILPWRLNSASRLHSQVDKLYQMGDESEGTPLHIMVYYAPWMASGTTGIECSFAEIPALRRAQ